MYTSTTIGIDIGGSHITAAIVNRNTRTIISGTSKRLHVNPNGAIEEIIGSWAGIICESLGSNDLANQKIGIAMPGPFDYEKGISLMKDNDKFAALFGLNIKALIADKLHMEADNILFMNDAAAFLKGELFGGAAMGYNKAIGLTLGTGLGTSKLNGHIAEDAALWCSPFLDGIAEDYLSTRWFVKRYDQLSGVILPGVKEIIALYPSDKNVAILLEEFATNLAAFLEIFINESQPEIVVMGGNIMNIENLFLPQVKAKLKHTGIDIPIVRAALGEDAAILGAGALVWDMEQ